MKKIKVWILIILFSLNFQCSKDDKERVINYHFNSESISKESYFVVFTPRGEDKPAPVLYLLTGGGGNPYSWTLVADLSWAAVEYNMYIISVASESNPYVNDPIDPTKRYEDYILEIIDIVDTNFNTLADKQNRAIAGISLGGGGALYLAGKHNDMFNSVSALSAGAMNPVYIVTEGLKDVRIMFDCGQQDALIDDNRALHTFLENEGISHLFYEYQGEHTDVYWATRAGGHFNFHATYFAR